MILNGQIDFRIGTPLIRPDINEILRILIDSKQPVEKLGRFLVLFRHDLFHNPADTGQNINGREMALISQTTV
ncbi:hypothetical protein D3C71_2060880 [compost metagenome]